MERNEWKRIFKEGVESVNKSEETREKQKDERKDNK